MFDWTEDNPDEAQPPFNIGGGLNGLLMSKQSGFVSGTRVASNLGWGAVDDLNIGDKVLTFDHGMQSIVDIQREALVAPDEVVPNGHRPILVPDGALINRKDIWLAPDQGILVESDAVTDALGDPFAVVPSRALEGLKGIRSASLVDRLDVITLTFEQDEVIYMEGGMLAHCPRPRFLLSDDTLGADAMYIVLDLEAARLLVDGLIQKQDASALTCDPEEIITIKTQEAQPSCAP